MRPSYFRYHDKTLSNDHEPTILCGIVNVTPDSFSDGGQYNSVDKALAQAQKLIQAGAGMIDIGGESTRPGSSYVPVEEEINRVVPVIRALKEVTDVPLSLDTWKADVAEAAIEAGIDIINDITGFLGDPRMAEVVGQSKAGAILMFNPVTARPDHPGSQKFPEFGDQTVFTAEEKAAFKKMPIEELMLAYLDKSLERAHAAGIEDDRIMLDPGIGFGLTKRENLSLIQKMSCLHDKGYWVFLGVSRKRFIQNMVEEAGYNVDVTTEEGFENRDEASAALSTIAARQGIEVVRVHTMVHHRIACRIGDAVRLADQMEDVNFGAYSNKD
ncbi:dihydropteroate synthase [Aerococcus sp. HMSC061A03]|uniref:dihydropteroate synthase n=1 Tax=Aerococcus sp. HMSC061A03 TaxID=1739396 RepID=UPI0008A1A3E3|nr:dihydropteroate synthase [Aerococcus sp. HMSC061A03]OFR35376.1 dihydropteroate synthase [Aerococcus sp. HMSC061A03]